MPRDFIKPPKCGAKGCAQDATHLLSFPEEVREASAQFDDDPFLALNAGLRKHEPVCKDHGDYACDSATRGWNKGRRVPKRKLDLRPMNGNEWYLFRKYERGDQKGIKKGLGNITVGDNGTVEKGIDPGLRWQWDEKLQKNVAPLGATDLWQGDTQGTEYPTPGQPYKDVVNRGSRPTQGGIRPQRYLDAEGNEVIKVGRGKAPKTAARPGRSSGSRKTGAYAAERDAGFAPYDERRATDETARAEDLLKRSVFEAADRSRANRLNDARMELLEDRAADEHARRAELGMPPARDVLVMKPWDEKVGETEAEISQMANRHDNLLMARKTAWAGYEKDEGDKEADASERAAREALVGSWNLDQPAEPLTRDGMNNQPPTNPGVGHPLMGVLDTHGQHTPEFAAEVAKFKDDQETRQRIGEFVVGRTGDETLRELFTGSDYEQVDGEWKPKYGGPHVWRPDDYRKPKEPAGSDVFHHKALRDITKLLNSDKKTKTRLTGAHIRGYLDKFGDPDKSYSDNLKQLLSESEHPDKWREISEQVRRHARGMDTGRNS